MRIIFNIGWWLERRMYEIKNQVEDQELPPRDDTVYKAWKAMYKANRQDKDYKAFNQTHNRYIDVRRITYIQQGYRKISSAGRNRKTSERQNKK